MGHNVAADQKCILSWNSALWTNSKILLFDKQEASVKIWEHLESCKDSVSTSH